MSENLFWSRWLFVLGIVVALAGLILAVLVPAVFPVVQEFFYGLFTSKPLGGMEASDLRHLNWVYGVLGATLLGWGLLIAGLAHQYGKHRYAWILNILLVSIVAWYVVDTALTLYYSAIPNVVLNTVILVLGVVPILLEKNGVKKEGN